MKLIFVLKSLQGDVRNLSYSLNETSVTKKFISLVQNIKENDYRIDYIMWGLSSNIAFDTINTIELLRTSISTYNSIYGCIDSKLLEIDYSNKFATIKDVNESLNKIHEDFEKNYNELNKIRLTKKHEIIITKLDSCLNTMNQCIHKLQILLNPSEMGFSTSLLCNTKQTPHIVLEENEYNLFSLNSSFGDLRLGYGTTGKALYHLYCDKDNLIFNEKGDLSNSTQQAIVASNLYAYFGNEVKEQNILPDFKQWCKTKKIAFDKRNGYIVLGKLIKPFSLKDSTNEEIVNYYSNYSTICDILIEN